jgi:hypothetical protein
MTSRQAGLVQAIAVLAWVTAMACGLGGVALRLLRPVPVAENSFGMGPIGMVAFAVLGMVWASVGALLMVRRTDNVVGRWMVLVGAGYAASILTAQLTSIAIVDGQATGSTIGLVAWLTGLTSLLGGGMFYLAVIFPTGRGHTPRWNRIGWFVLAATVVSGVILLIQPGPLHLYPSITNPFGIGPDLRGLFGGRFTVLITVGAGLWTLLIGAAVAARYRAGSHVERVQLRWFAWSVVLAASSLTFVGLAGVIRSARIGEAPLVAYALVGTTIPIAIGIAILRYRLYDIDRLISRTIGWALVTGILVAVFAGAVIGLQALLAGFTQGQTLAVAASTLAAFALFQPLRRRIQAAVDRRFDRARYDGQQTVDAFAEELRERLEFDDIDHDLHQVIHATVRPAHVGVWLRRQQEAGQ